VVKTTERKLDILSSLAFKLSKGVKATLPVFAVGRNGKVQLAGEIPQCIILRFM
jgi:hypothetical protein